MSKTSNFLDPPTQIFANAVYEWSSTVWEGRDADVVSRTNQKNRLKIREIF